LLKFLHYLLKCLEGSYNNKHASLSSLTLSSPVQCFCSFKGLRVIKSNSSANSYIKCIYAVLRFVMKFALIVGYLAAWPDLRPCFVSFILGTFTPLSVSVMCCFICLLTGNINITNSSLTFYLLLFLLLVFICKVVITFRTHIPCFSGCMFRILCVETVTLLNQ